MQQNANGWLQGIQYFRAIAIIEVIVLHATLVVGNTNLAVFSLLKGIIVTVASFSACAVFHFIFISGVVLYNKYSGAFSLSTFYKKRFSSVLPPYLVWSTFYYFYPLVILALYSALFRNPTNYGSDLNLSGYAAGLAVGIQHLWFIVLIMQLYLLYPLLVRVYNRYGSKNPIYVLSLLLLVQVVYNILFNPTGMITTGYRAFFLTGIFYFVFGFFTAERYGTLKQKLARVGLTSISLVVLLSTICFAFIFYHILLVLTSPTASPAQSIYVWLYQITMPFYCLLLIFFYLRISLEWGEPKKFFTRYLEKIGADSFGIYLIHFFFISAFAFTLSRGGISYDNLLFYPTLIFLTLISSYCGVQALYHLPFSTIIIGRPRKKSRVV